MCLIGLLLPFTGKTKSQEHKPRQSSSHRRSERPHREHSSRDRSRREYSRREYSRRQQEKDELKALSFFPEDTLARLTMTLEQSFLQEQQRGWGCQERLERLEQLQRENPIIVDAAPRYTVRDENAYQPTTTAVAEPLYQGGVADSPDCRNESESVDSACGCCCCGNRCGCASAKSPAVPELYP